ncbi:hypothetical protein AVEN_129333-1 [Araneus ventricosus]|uniref:Uncharacterized protein n=1 Tax=Araneus ventricosus TaxID=182803 RepID=A0A4Y2QJV2_ARAVE|nr:hypothetical protein AVEN_129333-1 [Araneus ventricosus]
MFPEQPVASAPTLHHPRSKDYFLQLTDVTVFSFKLHDQLLNFHTLLQGTPRTWSNEVLRDNFVRTALESSKLAPFQPRKVNFEKLEERFSRPVQRGLRNTDVRAGFCWNDHEFLVKAYFTFGQRTVPKGQVHLYQTTDAPMLFYKLNDGLHNSSFRVEDKWFHRLDQYIYDQFVLQPHCTYAVPEYTTYTILTVQKTLFCVHVLPVEALGTEGKHPDADRHLLGAAPAEVEKKQKKRRGDDDFASNKRVRADILQQATNQNISVPEQQQMLFDRFGQQQIIFEEFNPAFLQSSAPVYTPGTSLDTMVTESSSSVEVAGREIMAEVKKTRDETRTFAHVAFQLDQYVYDQFVLQPHSTYAVPEYTTYTILTVQKTLFSAHVLPMEALRAE